MTKLELLKLNQSIRLRLAGIQDAMDINDLIRSGDEDMAVDPQVAALVVEFDNATNAIAARIQRLIDGGTLSADSAAALQDVVGKLTLLGQDPNNPVPTSLKR